MYLTNFASSLGRPTFARSCGVDASAVADSFRSDSIDRFLDAGSSTAPLLAAAALTSALAGIPEASYPILYCSETFDGGSPSDAAAACLTHAGLADRAIICISGHGCGNALWGLVAARAAIAFEQLPGVLLVTSDRVTGERFTPSGSTYMSDGAVACVVSPMQLGRSVRVLGWAYANRADLDLSATDLSVTRTTLQGIRRAMNDLLEKHCIQQGDLQCCVVNNYGTAARQLLTSGLGVGPDKVVYGAPGLHGHAFAADILLTLNDLMSSGRLTNGDLIVLLGSGLRSWITTLVQYVA